MSEQYQTRIQMAWTRFPKAIKDKTRKEKLGTQKFEIDKPYQWEAQEKSGLSQTETVLKFYKDELG